MIDYEITKATNSHNEPSLLFDILSCLCFFFSLFSCNAKEPTWREISFAKPTMDWDNVPVFVFTGFIWLAAKLKDGKKKRKKKDE